MPIFHWYNNVEENNTIQKKYSFFVLVSQHKNKYNEREYGYKDIPQP